MENTIFLQELLEELNAIIPQKQLVNELAEMLAIEKASVYRRIKGKIPFSFFEVALIARNTGISLDKVIKRLPSGVKSFILPTINYANPTEDDYELITSQFQQLEFMKQCGNTELTEACNILPQNFCCKYEYLTRFYIFKWLHQYQSNKSCLYTDTLIDGKLKKVLQDYLCNYKKIIQRSHYIFDHLLFYYIVNDLKYFSSLGLITSGEILLIKDDLKSMINDIEHSTVTGTDPDSGNEVFFYISNINLDTNYLYMQADGFQISAIKIFLLSAAGSMGKTPLDEIKRWIESLKRHSILITGCNEVKGRLYFEKQRKLINRL